MTTSITEVTYGSSTSGTATTAAAFITLVSEFLNVTQSNFADVKITSVALGIVTVKVNVIFQHQNTIDSSKLWQPSKVTLFAGVINNNRGDKHVDHLKGRKRLDQIFP